jgi:hypothetical protein
MSNTVQWTVEPALIDSNNVIDVGEKYNIVYAAGTIKTYTVLLTTDAANFALPTLSTYRALEIKSDQLITVGIYTNTTATIKLEFPSVTNLILKANYNNTSTTSAWYMRNEATTAANVIVRIFST